MGTPKITSCGQRRSGLRDSNSSCHGVRHGLECVIWWGIKLDLDEINPVVDVTQHVYRVNIQLDSIMKRPDRIVKALRLSAHHVRGCRSDLQPHLPGVRASSALETREHLTFTNAEWDYCSYLKYSNPARTTLTGTQGNNREMQEMVGSIEDSNLASGATALCDIVIGYFNICHHWNCRLLLGRCCPDDVSALGNDLRLFL